MKKTTTILCLGIALCMLGCSDDDDQVTTTSTVPFSLTASLSPRSSDAEDTGILQGNWDANSQLAVIKTGSSGVPKSILTRKTDSSDSFTGNLSTLVKNENEIAVFYPAAAITANSSDTLTQTLNLSGQDGTLAGITNYDYLWAQCKAGMNETTGSSACEMTSLVTIGKFQFTVNGGSPLNNITRITITATAGTLYSSAVMKLKNGEFSSTQTGNITIKNKAGISGTTYISFFPSEAQLHFTLVTTTGEVYEAATSTTIKLEKGKVYEAPALTCTLLPSAKVGDYYYSDATFSSEKNENKTCIGIVYALDDADGNLSPTLSTSPFGRIVALGDNQSSTKWISKAEDIEGIENYTTADGTLTSGVLPYYNGTADSFFSDKDEERIKGATIHVETGQPATWVSEGAISDFNGKAHTAYLGKSSSSYPAGGYCYQYSTSGKSAGEWYLPSAGELTLLWELQKAGIICKDKQDCFNDFARKAYWSSSEHSAESAWHLNFVSGAIVANSKASNYATRPVAQF